MSIHLRRITMSTNWLGSCHMRPGCQGNCPLTPPVLIRFLLLSALCSLLLSLSWSHFGFFYSSEGKSLQTSCALCVCVSRCTQLSMSVYDSKVRCVSDRVFLLSVTQRGHCLPWWRTVIPICCNNKSVSTEQDTQRQKRAALRSSTLPPRSLLHFPLVFSSKISQSFLTYYFISYRPSFPLPLYSPPLFSSHMLKLEGKRSGNGADITITVFPPPEKVKKINSLEEGIERYLNCMWTWEGRRILLINWHTLLQMTATWREIKNRQRKRSLCLGVSSESHLIKKLQGI